MKVRVGLPNVGNKNIFLPYVEAILDSKSLTNDGPLVQQLEEKLCEILQVKHCICVCNGTVALMIAIKALGLGGEVIIPSFTFVATAHALSWLGLTPIFADINTENWTIDTHDILNKITEQTTGIIGVHLFGQACYINELTTIANQYKLALCFDAAHAFGCTYHGINIGSFGRCEVFSFHATKIFNTFEGGAITTNDAELAYQIRLMRNFGFVGYDSISIVGTNGKMTEISAAMGLTNLLSLHDFIRHNQHNYHAYCNYLANCNSVRLLHYNSLEQYNYQYIIALAESEQHRNYIIDQLLQHKIMARKYFYPGIHKMKPYSSHVILPNTEYIADRVLALPTGQSVSTDNIHHIAEIIKQC